MFCDSVGIVVIARRESDEAISKIDCEPAKGGLATKPYLILFQ